MYFISQHWFSTQAEGFSWLSTGSGEEACWHSHSWQWGWHGRAVNTVWARRGRLPGWGQVTKPAGAPSLLHQGTMEGALLFFNWRVQWVTNMLDQVWSDRDRCCWVWIFISGGFGALLCCWSKELLLLGTVGRSTLRGTVWPGVSPSPDRSRIEYMLSCTCSGCWPTYLFTWQRESSIPTHLS